jgi:hypothetical protein
MGRVEDYLGDRLRGRAVPADLRRLVELELDGVLRGRGSVQPFAEVHVLAPAELHGLMDPRYRRPEDSAATVANWRAMDDVLGHTAVVVDGFNGDLFGYWLHPDEPASDQPAILKLDTEGEFETLDGATLVDAMVWDWIGYDVDPEYFARIVDFCERHAIPFGARDRDGLRRAETVVDPVLLHDRQYKRYQPFTRRPEWADAAEEGAAPVGRRITDPPLRALLERLGYPDPVAAVEALDEGIGEVRLTPPAANVTLVLYQDEDRSWWLFSVRYRQPTPERPLEVPLPFGFSLAESREATRARFGPDHRTPLLVRVDRWEIGPVTAYVMFDKDDARPTYVEFWPRDVIRR